MLEGAAVESTEEACGKRFELICALTLAIFAALLAITDLGGGRYGDEEITGTNEKANIYSWYQSKSVKQSLVEGQRDLLRTLMEANAVREEQLVALHSLEVRLDQDIARYKKEKAELLLGSVAVGRENWVQDVEGELGRIIGAKEWEKKLEVLGRAGDGFDLSVLFLQLSLVIGAVSMVLQEQRLKWSFYGAMLLLGTIGVTYSVQAFRLAMAAG